MNIVVVSILVSFVYFIILLVFLSQKGPETSVVNLMQDWPIESAYLTSITPSIETDQSDNDYWRLDFQPYPGATSYEAEVIGNQGEVSNYEGENFGKKIVLPNNATKFRTSTIDQYQLYVIGVILTAITAEGRARIQLYLFRP